MGQTQQDLAVFIDLSHVHAVLSRAIRIVHPNLTVLDLYSIMTTTRRYLKFSIFGQIDSIKKLSVDANFHQGIFA